MGNLMQRRTPESLIPKDVREVFDETDIDKVWAYLRETFHLNVSRWQRVFEQEYRQSSRNMTKMEVFVRFGQRHWLKAFNIILAREELHPTWIDLLRYIVKEKIEAKRRESSENMRVHGRDSHYKVTNTKY
jgi:hypothetical protein